MTENQVIQPPSLFDFATSELSQDAFICWLASWASPSYRTCDTALHTTATALLDRLLEIGMGPNPSAYQLIQVRRQWKDVDVLIVVNGDTAIIIEDKTITKDHSGQLEKYKKAIAGEFQENRIAAVYLKTGDQGNYRSVKEAGYGCFLRPDFLAILDQGEQAGVTNDIFADFHGRLRRIEEVVQSYQRVPLAEWDKDSNRWAGFFLALQQRLGKGDWKYVPNKRGGFMGFWWHWLSWKSGCLGGSSETRQPSAPTRPARTLVKAKRVSSFACEYSHFDGVNRLQKGSSYEPAFCYPARLSGHFRHARPFRRYWPTAGGTADRRGTGSVHRQ